MTGAKYPQTAVVLSALQAAGAPLYDRLMARAIAESDSSDAQKWEQARLQNVIVAFTCDDPAVWEAGEALVALLDAFSDARRAGAADLPRLEATARKAIHDAPLDVYCAAMHLRRSNVIAYEHVSRRRMIWN